MIGCCLNTCGAHNNFHYFISLVLYWIYYNSFNEINDFYVANGIYPVNKAMPNEWKCDKYIGSKKYAY